MTGGSPFDHRRDLELGAALQEVLSAPDDEEFSRGIVARIRWGNIGRADPQAWWDVLGAWARPGLAAAVVLALAGTVWLSEYLRAPDAPDVAGVRSAAATVTPAALLAARALSEVDIAAVLVGEIPEPAK